MPAASLSPIRRTAVVLVAVGLAATLAACVEQSPAPSPTSPATPSETPLPVPSISPTSGADVLDIPCSEFVDPDAIYAFNPNFALIGAWEPEPGTAAADAAAAGGVACRWVTESGGATMDVSAARYTDDQILTLKNEAFSGSEMVPTYGDEAYFEVEDGVGTAIVFQGRFRLVASSEAFAEPGEPTEIIDSALAALAALPPAP
jgi:hypothetical protein